MSQPKTSVTVLPPAGDRRTVIEEGTTLRGSLSSTCALLVSGVVEGEVTAPEIVVAASGALSGRVRAAELRSDGALSGDFEVERLELAGVVHDATRIRTGSIAVKPATAGGPAPVLLGDCVLEVGDPPRQLASAGHEPDARVVGAPLGASA